MSAELRQRIHDHYLDYLAGRLDAVLSNFDDDVDFVISAPPDVFPHIGRKKGKAALAAILLKAQAEYEYLRYRPHVIVGEADSAAIIIPARLRQRSTGRIIDLFIAKFLRFRDGRIVEVREFVDKADAVEQLFARKDALAR